MVINETVKLVIAVAIGCALLFGVQKVYDWREAAQQNEQRGRTLEATSGIVQDSGKADTQRIEVDIGVAGAKQAFKQALEEAKTHEPETAARADRPVPDSVRRAYRERRLARERLGCAGQRCESRSPAEDTAER